MIHVMDHLCWYFQTTWSYHQSSYWARKLSPFQNKGSILENHDLPSVIIKSELFINLLLLQNKASNVENSVAASWNLLPLVATGKTSLCSSPRYSDTVLSATYQQLNTHKDFTLFSTYLFNQYRCSLLSQYLQVSSVLPSTYQQYRIRITHSAVTQLIASQVSAIFYHHCHSECSVHWSEWCRSLCAMMWKPMWNAGKHRITVQLHVCLKSKLICCGNSSEIVILPNFSLRRRIKSCCRDSLVSTLVLCTCVIYCRQCVLYICTEHV